MLVAWSTSKPLSNKFLWNNYFLKLDGSKFTFGSIKLNDSIDWHPIEVGGKKKKKTEKLGNQPHKLQTIAMNWVYSTDWDRNWALNLSLQWHSLYF